MARNDYSIAEIKWLLSNYGDLESGYMPGQDSAEWADLSKKRSSSRSPFEIRACLKADIDRGIQGLPVEEKLVILAVNIDGRRIEDCAFWLEKTFYEVVKHQTEAISKMARILSGKTARRRKKKEVETNDT